MSKRFKDWVRNRYPSIVLLTWQEQAVKMIFSGQDTADYLAVPFRAGKSQLAELIKEFIEECLDGKVRVYG